MNAKIAKRSFRQHAHQLGHGVDEGFDADEAGARISSRLMQQVLAATEADLQPDIGDICFEKARQVAWRRGFEVDGVAAQTLIQRNLLERTHGSALAATEKRLGRPAAPALDGHRRISRQAVTASLSAFARSVRSHEKEPSRPALRPKWP